MTATTPVGRMAEYGDLTNPWKAPMSTSARPSSSTTSRSAGRTSLDAQLQRHWRGEGLVSVDELPPDPNTVSTSARFAAEVTLAAPAWVMLPVPPTRRDTAKRHVAALRRRGLEAAMRPHPQSSTAWAIWARANTSQQEPGHGDS